MPGRFESANPDYFQLIFECPLTEAPVDTSQKYWVFDSLFAEGFNHFIEILKKDFDRNSSLILEPKALQDLSQSCQSGLRFLLGPVFHANYEGFLRLCEQDDISHQDNAELQGLFLQLMHEEGTARLFDTNVYLRETAQSIIQGWIRSTKKFLERLEQDFDEIYQNLSRSQPQPKDLVKSRTIKAIKCDLSDSHNGREAVRIVEFADEKKVVYKPRALAIEAGFYRWLQHLNEAGFQPKLYLPWLLDKHDYGWMEACEPLTDIEDECNVELYARQFGALSTLWYLIGGTDLHQENILFTKQGVVIVDCETAFEADFHYRFLNKPLLYPRVEPNAWMHTILSTQAFSAFYSDLDGVKETVSPVAGISSFRKLYKNKAKSVSSSSKKQWHARPLTFRKISWNVFADFVCQSIEETFTYFRDLPIQSTINTIKHSFCGSIPSRLLIRPTASYAALLYNLSIDFNIVQSREKTLQSISEQLEKIPALLHFQGLESAEIFQLADFDIPYVSRILGENRIVSSGNFEYRFDDPLDFLSLKHRLEWLKDPVFIQNELHLVKLVLYPAPPLQQYKELSRDSIKNHRLLHAHCTSFYHYLPFDRESSIQQTLFKIAKHVRTEMEQLNSSEYTFALFSFENDEAQYEPIALSYSLCVGLAGKLLFLGLYAFIAKQQDLLDFVLQKLEYFIQLGHNETYILENRRSLGTGYQSLVYVYECFSRLGVLQYPVELAKLALSLEDGVKNELDLLNADSGHALLLSLFKEKLPDALFQGWELQLKREMQKLINNWESKNDRERLGLAHGALGACLAASRIYKVHQDCGKLKKLTLTLLKLEKDLFQKNLHSEEKLSRHPYGWCQGEAGRALIYYEVGRSFNMPEFTDEAMSMTSWENKNLQFENHTLCCGSLGFIAAHMTVRQNLREYQDKTHRLQKLKTFYENSTMLLTETKRQSPCMMSSGLLYGLSGLGIVLLYCLEPDVVPAVWMFE